MYGSLKSWQWVTTQIPVKTWPMSPSPVWQELGLEDPFPRVCSSCQKSYSGYCQPCTTQVESASNPRAMTTSERERETYWLLQSPASIPHDVIWKRLEKLAGQPLAETDLSLPEKVLRLVRANKAS